MTAVKLVAAVGQQHEHAFLTQAASQERSERAGRAVGPVHVLENQHDGLKFAEQVQQLEHSLEQAKLASGLELVGGGGCLIVEARHERRELRSAAAAQLVERRMAGAHQRPERSQEGRVRKLGVALLDCLAPQDNGVVGMALLELPYKARLAHTRLAAEQHECRAPFGGFSQARLKLRKLPDAADEVSARQSCAHE